MRRAQLLPRGAMVCRCRRRDRTALRPEHLDGRVVLWHVAIVRIDDVATMTACASDPDGALAELVCYTAADAKERTR